MSGNKDLKSKINRLFRPQRVVKGDYLGRCVGIAVLKGWSRVGAWTSTLKNPTKCLRRLSPTVGPNTSSSVRLDIYVPLGSGGLSRECVLRIPMRVVKGD